MACDPQMSEQRAFHWETAYETRGEDGVSWFQSVPTVSLDLINRLGVSPSSAVLDIGGGASSLVDHLIGRGFCDLTVLDIAEKALAAARNRLGVDASVAWIHADLLQWIPERQFDLWHDRAVFHFLVEDHERKKYLENLQAALRSDGSVVIATFAEDGPEFCSGLPVCRYSADELSSVLGNGFKVVATRREEHLTPSRAMQSFTWVAATKTPDSPQGGA